FLLLIGIYNPLLSSLLVRLDSGFNEVPPQLAPERIARPSVVGPLSSQLERTSGSSSANHLR
ncbi:unnamed protein product, partial [Brassica oleracea]